MADISKQTIKRVTVALNLSASNDERLRLAKKIHKSMSVSPFFTASDEKIKTLETLVDNLESAQLALSTKPPTTTVASRNVKADLLIACLRRIRSDVQELADANPSNAKDIIIASGMDVKKDIGNNRKYNVAKDGPHANSIIVVGAGLGVREWRISTNEEDWINLPSTYTARTIITNLISGTLYFIQYRIVLKNNLVNTWSSSISFKVK